MKENDYSLELNVIEISKNHKELICSNGLKIVLNEEIDADKFEKEFNVKLIPIQQQHKESVEVKFESEKGNRKD